MERARAVHTMMVEMTTGMLVLAALAVLVLTWLALTGRFGRDGLGAGADAVALWGAAIGTPMIALAIVSGFRQWPLEAFMSSVIARNKILTSLLALGFWLAFVAIRLAAGRPLWHRKGLAVYACVLAVAGSVALVFTASIGGALADKPSGFEEIARTFVETRRTFVLSPTTGWVAIALGAVAPIAALLVGRRRGH
jgi:hypothetical protein